MRFQQGGAFERFIDVFVAFEFVAEEMEEGEGLGDGDAVFGELEIGFSLITPVDASDERGFAEKELEFWLSKGRSGFAEFPELLDE